MKCVVCNCAMNVRMDVQRAFCDCPTCPILHFQPDGTTAVYVKEYNPRTFNWYRIKREMGIGWLWVGEKELLEVPKKSWLERLLS